MRFLFIVFILFYVTYESNAQRTRGLANMSKEEIEAKRKQDSIDNLYKDFDVKDYLLKLKEIKAKNDSTQLNATLEMLNAHKGYEDTVKHLFIQASTLSVLPNHITKYSNLEQITLRRCKSLNLNDLFEKVKDLPKLKVLSIEFSEKTNIPNSIGFLKYLEELNLEGNKIENLPDSLILLSNLKTINLRNNINLIEDNAFLVLSKLPNLKIVQFSGSRVASIPKSIGDFKSLETLDLSKNLIVEIPDEISNCTTLKSIDLSYNKKLNPTTTLVKLSQIKSLENLIIQSSGITEIPATIGLLSNLKKIDLENNPIKKIHEEIGGCKNLEMLILGSDWITKERMELKSLPKTIGACQKLKHLKLSLCSISELPSTFNQLQALEYIDLSWNQLSFIPVSLFDLKNLKYINLSLNKIENLPGNFVNWSYNLEELHLAANFFAPAKEKIKSLPQNLSQLKKLKVLNLRDQIIETLPLNVFNQLKELETLNLMGGILQFIPDDITALSKLKNLNLKGNELKKLPDNLYLLNQLEDLNIAYNPDLNFDEIALILEKMPFVKHLDISYNNFDLSAAKLLQKKIPHTKIAKDEVKGKYGQSVERKKK